MEGVLLTKRHDIDAPANGAPALFLLISITLPLLCRLFVVASWQPPWMLMNNFLSVLGFGRLLGPPCFSPYKMKLPFRSQSRIT